MPISHTALRRLLQLWHAEHERVEQAAAAINLDRARWMTLAVAVLNLLNVVLFWVKLAAHPDPQSIAYRWHLALIFSHFLMGLCMVALAVVAHRLRHASRSWWGRAISVVIIATGMLFAITVVALDQWVTPNITPFLIACMVSGLAIYLRPLPSAVLYVAAYLGFFYALGLTQTNAELLLSNRSNGLTACALGWALSVVLWRKFTIITLQQMQLEAANAALQDKQHDLERLTRNDGLTGLFNRNTFAELTRRELDRAQRQGTPTSILVLDLDHFKRINDTWGHPAGDAVLKNLAAIASTTVRSTDLVGRLGGEEFTVLLPATSIEAARRLAEKLRNRLQNSPTVWEGQTIACTASIGVAGTTALEKHDYDTLYRDADKALYVAKTQGRNRVV